MVHGLETMAKLNAATGTICTNHGTPIPPTGETKSVGAELLHRLEKFVKASPNEQFLAMLKSHRIGCLEWTTENLNGRYDELLAEIVGLYDDAISLATLIGNESGQPLVDPDLPSLSRLVGLFKDNPIDLNAGWEPQEIKSLVVVHDCNCIEGQAQAVYIDGDWVASNEVFYAHDIVDAVGGSDVPFTLEQLDIEEAPYAWPGTLDELKSAVDVMQSEQADKSIFDDI